ncbi:hypothetical protein BJ878DRAFT_571846 [Calycina marina]|uniref:Calponin-homology (CH) domain-containing protein n=1 Tax=Calycina marina TaxID=1763456 RepID=A0A9P7ZC44_9HELO|nr:hypothetical protein BJ878DRAFT_571846 [Calycina marina]
MASVTSLDKDMRKLRLDRYTPQAAKEARTFIEDALEEQLSKPDLIDSLKDGVALCKLVNLAVPNTVRFKTKAVMPFVQMENISIFLEACKKPPFNLQSHDVFLTVDLYESKDPAQVLQCLSSFSRAAHRIQPSIFPETIGGKSKGSVMSPQSTGAGQVGGGSYGNRGRGVSNTSNSSSAYNPSSRAPSSLTPSQTGDSNSGRWSATKPSTATSPGVSSWSKKANEGATSPAWNISQYGYMGGASQGNLGVSFGGRRQITSAGPDVPNILEKQKKRKEKEAEEERLRLQVEEEGRVRRAQIEAEEEQACIEEEQRWAEEARKLRERERQKAEEEKRKWEEEEQIWRLEEERRQKEEQEAEARLQNERSRARGNSDARLQGQFLSQYQADNGVKSGYTGGKESSRIIELERELEQARERERQYERARQVKPRIRQVVEDHDISERLKAESKSRNRSRSRPRAPARQPSDESWRQDERNYLRQQYSSRHSHEQSHENVPSHDGPSRSPRPLPEPVEPVRVKTNHTGPSTRPLPDPAIYAQQNAASQNANRTDKFLSSNPAPQNPQSKMTYSNEIGQFDSAAERDAENRRRAASQTKTKASGWASKSLLEREMENERQRQQEWEESQKELKKKVHTGAGVDGIGGGIGGNWDVNQWTGYTGGDGQNRGTQGIGSGRRQIVGPRPPPDR